MVNSNNTASENFEQDIKKDQLSLKQQFIEDLIKENKSGDGKLDINFVEQVMNNDPLPSGIIEQMRRLKSGINKYRDDFDLDSIDVYDLRRLVAGDYIKLDTAKKLFIANVKKSYVIDNENKVSNLIDGKDEKEILSFINSPSKLEILLKDKFEKIEIKDLFSSFESLDNEGIKNRLRNKSPEEMNEISFILNKIKSLNFNDSDVRGLFEFDFLSYKEKQDIIDVYIPVIDLQRAISIGLVDINQAKNIKGDIVNNYVNKNLDADLLDVVTNSVSFEDIKINTKELYTEDTINLISENIGFQELEKDFKKLLEKAKSEIIQKGPRSFDDLLISLDEINDGNRFKNLEKFRVGNVFKSITKDHEGKDVITFFEISSIDDRNSAFDYKIIGEGSSISLENASKTNETKLYNDFFEGIKGEKAINFEFFTYSDIKDQIKDGILSMNEFTNTSFDSLDEDSQNELVEKKVGELTSEINELHTELLTIKEGKEKDIKVKQLEQKQNQLDNYTNNKNNSTASRLVNQQKFIKKIDEVDPEGSNFGFGKGVVFQTKDGLFEIDGFEDSITLINSRTGEIEPRIDFELFFQIFKEKKAKRLENIQDFDTLISNKKNDDKKWEGYEFKSGNLVTKGSNGGKKGDQITEYLVSDKNNELIKINNISGNNVTIQLGERKDYSDLDKDEKKKSKIGEKDKGEKIYLDDREFTITLTDLDILISKDELYPNWKSGKTIKPEKEKGLQNEFHGSFISKYLKCWSVKELLAGGKMLVDGIEETLKKGNDLNAAKFANGLGKILPRELSEEILIKVERAQQEEQDKELESLGKVDSWMAIERIEKWLKNKDTPEYKKEAAIIFMLKGYGHLTSKRALHKYRGKWFWYEALGGKINDKLFIEEKEKAEKSNITFSEEYLVHILLKQQCSKRKTPYRRSRLHKEYEHNWKAGINDEYEKGYGDADKKRTARDIANGGHDEADTGTTSNAIGWYKKAVERGGSLEEMSEGFFALLFSGALYDVDQATFLKIKNLWDADGMPIIMTRFSTTKSDMVLFNKTVVKLCEKIEKAYPDKHKGIKKAATELFDKALAGKGEEGDRYGESVDFWKKHGTPIARALNMANLKDDKYGLTDKIIFLEKDTDDDFKGYYNNVRAFTDLDSFFGKGFIDEDCGEVGITGLNVNALTKKYLNLGNNRKFRDTKSGGRVWDEISEDMINTKNKRFDKDDTLDRKKKEEYLVHILRELTAGFFENMGGQTIESYNDPTSETGKYFNSWKLNIWKDLGEFSSSDIISTDTNLVNTKKVESILLRTARNILDGKGISDDGIVNPLDVLTSSTKEATNKTVNNTGSDDYDDLKAA